MHIPHNIINVSYLHLIQTHFKLYNLTLIKSLSHLLMNLHCGFLFPKTDFKLIFMNTLGYISDNVFYRINLQTLQTQIFHHPQGRSYQAFTACAKRQLVVLVDYGKNPTFYFEYHEKQKSFDVRNICPLQVTRVELSLNAKYLAIVCGTPTPQLIFYDIENRRMLPGSRSAINLSQNYKEIKRIEFNPGNPRQVAIQFSASIQIHEMKQFYELDSSQQLQESIMVKKVDVISDTEVETFRWDELNNLYISNGKEVYIYSTDTKARLLSCDIEIDHDDDGPVVANILLTRKHAIVFYRTGRVQWLNKYYPEAMEEEDVSLRPFYLDKYFEAGKKIAHSIYDGQMTKIFISFAEGCFGILPKAAESNEADEEEEESGKKESKATTEKKVDVELTLTPYYHASPIVMIHEFQNTAACATLSSAGRFILWSVKGKKQMQTYAIQGGINCATVNKPGNVLATGHSNGVVRFYSIAKPNEIFLFKEFKLVNNGPIDKVAFSANSDELAVLSTTENRIYYILSSLSMDFEVLGYVEVPFTVKSIAWMGPTKSNIPARYEYLLVCLGFGVLMINSPPPVPTKKRGKDLDLKLDIYALKTDPNQTLVAGLSTGELLTTGKDKYIKKYKQPQQLISKIDWKSKTPPNPPAEQFDGHDFDIEILQHSQHFFLSGGRQGKVQLRDYSNFKDFKEVKAYGWKNNLLSCVVGSWNRGLLYTAGKDGSFYMWKVGDWQVKGQDKVELQVPNFKKINPTPQPKYYELVIEDQYWQRNKDKIEQKKKVQISKLTKIRQQLKTLLEENNQHQQMQRLNRDQFAIDLQSKQRVWKQGQQLCQKIVQQSKKKILIYQVQAKKLKDITWHRMDVHLSAINGLKNNYVVYNYQIRKIPAQQKRKVKLILDLRTAQKRQEKKRTLKINDVEDYNNKNIVNSGFITPLIMTQIEAKKEDNKKDDKKKKKQDEPAQPANALQEQSEEIPAEEEWQLLYSSFELYNSNSKRNQIIMMKNIITLIKKSFNKEFNKLIKFRQNQNEMISDKNKRIVEICEELKRENELVVSRDNILESNDNVLEVKLSEIPFQRYLSREEREKLEKERLKEEERLRKLAEDDSGQRALQKMMGGTLEEKKVSALQITVQKQKWMQKPVEQMSEQEKSKLKDYEQKKQKAEEEKERIVKKLQAQLRKLKQQIDQIMQKYDQKLFELLKRKIEYDYRIQEQELYCARLALTLLDQQEQTKRYNELQKHIAQSKLHLENLANNKTLLATQSQDFESLKQQKKQTLDKQRLGQFESKIKTIEKTIFEDYHTNVKKRREFEDKLLDKYPPFKNLILPLDPFKDIESKNLSDHVQKHYTFFVHQVKTLQQTFDIPQNAIQKLLENRFNLRRQEHELQDKLKILSSSMQNLQLSIEENHKQLNKDESQLKTIEEFLIKCKSDLDIEIRIKQGQVEINQQKPVPDLQDALLIAKGQIDEKNFKIKQQANQKISVMKEIKTCKIKVTEESLNLEKKQQHIDKLSSMIKEIQMLKVKKEMQVALSKKDAKMNENELKSLKEQIQKVRKEGEKRIALFEQKIKKILKEIETIKKENKQLETQKWNLETTVKQREKIKDMMCGDGEQGQESAEKFSQISINRQLFDKAKQQTEEIELLREELSKLKAKTFANFSNVQR